MIKKYNITVPKKYTKDGTERTLWQNVGVLTEFIKETGEISRKIEIPAIGLDAQAFPFSDKDTQTKPATPKKEMTAEEEYNSINPDEIPY